MLLEEIILDFSLFRRQKSIVKNKYNEKKMISIYPKKTNLVLIDIGTMYLSTYASDIQLKVTIDSYDDDDDDYVRK